MPILKVDAMQVLFYYFVTFQNFCLKKVWSNVGAVRIEQYVKWHFFVLKKWPLHFISNQLGMIVTGFGALSVFENLCWNGHSLYFMKEPINSSSKKNVVSKNVFRRQSKFINSADLFHMARILNEKHKRLSKWAY